MIVNDQRIKKNFKDVVVGDILVDKQSIMYLIVYSYQGDCDYGLLSLDTLEIEYVEEEVIDLIEEFDNNRVLSEIIPKEKISINIC